MSEVQNNNQINIAEAEIKSKEGIINEKKKIEKELLEENKKIIELNCIIENLKEDKLKIEDIFKNHEEEMNISIKKLEDVLTTKEEKIEKIATENIEIKCCIDKLELDYKECLGKNAELFNIIEEKNTKNKKQELMCINLLNEKEQSNILAQALQSENANLKSELNEIKLQIEENKSKIFLLVNEKKDISFKVETQVEENQKYINELELRRSLIDSLQKEKNEASYEIIELNKKISENTETIDILKKKSDSYTIEITELKKELDNREIVNKKLESELINKEKQILKINKEYETVYGQLKSENEKNIAYDEELRISDRKIKEFEENKDKYSRELENKLKIISENEKKEKEYLECIKKLEETVKNLSSKKLVSKNKSNSKIEELISKISENDSKILSLQSIIDENQHEISQKGLQISELQSEKMTLASQISDVYSSQELLRNEIELNHKEIKTLKEELKQKSEVIKTSSVNMNFTRDEINTWKKCIEEKNLTIQELKTQLDSLKQDMEQNQNDKYHEKQCEYLTGLLEVKEAELKDMKSKGIASMEIENSIIMKSKQIEMTIKTQEAIQSELKSIKNELTTSLDAREVLMQDIKSLRDDDFRNKKEINDTKKLISQLKQDNLRFIKEIAKLNEENIKLIEKEENSEKVIAHERYVNKIKKLEENIQSLEAQVKIKSIEIEKYSKRLVEIRKKTPEDSVLRKELEKQAAEINNLTDGLAKITDLVFGLPSVTIDPEETSIIESTIKVIKQMHSELQAKEKELNDKRMIRRGDPTSQSTGNFKSQIDRYHPSINSPSEKSTRLLSPTLKGKVNR